MSAATFYGNRVEVLRGRRKLHLILSYNILCEGGGYYNRARIMIPLQQQQQQQQQQLVLINQPNKCKGLRLGRHLESRGHI
jgi:hypothetical protein